MFQDPGPNPADFASSDFHRRPQALDLLKRNDATTQLRNEPLVAESSLQKRRSRPETALTRPSHSLTFERAASWTLKQVQGDGAALPRAFASPVPSASAPATLQKIRK
jgi:hypothetical protein